MAQSEITDHAEPKYKDEDWLRKQWRSGKETKQIAREAGCATSTISYWKDKHGLPDKQQMATDDKPWRDEEWLREKYVDEGMSGKEIAELADAHEATIYTWMGRHGIESREFEEVHAAEGKYTDEGWLREKYIDEGLSTLKMADMCDCDSVTISRWLGIYDIPARPVGSHPGRANPNFNEYASFRTSEEGYGMSFDYSYGEQNMFATHRLAAVAWYGWDAVVGKEVHHRIPIPYMNVESNLHPIGQPEHRIIGQRYRHHGVPEDVVDGVLDGLGE